MQSLTRVTLVYSGFVFFVLIDLGLRFVWLSRAAWTCNEGIFWGVAFPDYLLLGGSIVLLGYLSFLWRQAGTLALQWGSLAALLGGGVNLADRLAHGCVLDYLAWPGMLSTVFPHFNIADGLLLFGLLSLIGISLWHHQTDPVSVRHK